MNEDTGEAGQRPPLAEPPLLSQALSPVTPQGALDSWQAQSLLGDISDALAATGDVSLTAFAAAR